jgi:hypothetical protein
MSPSNLQGLNIVQPSESYLADSHDSQDLLSNLSHFPELSAQLGLWTNLAFESDEPPLVDLDNNDKNLGGDEATRPTLSVEDDEDDDTNDGQPAQADNHDNVVVADPVPPRPTQPRTASHPVNAFDIGNLLAGFGIDPFMVPPVQSTSTAPSLAPSLAHLLSLYPHAAYPLSQAPASAEQSAQPPAAKRARVRRRSSTAGTNDSANDTAPPSPAATVAPAISSSLSPAEDKRRRNTAASARFRLKKKEREAALEKKSKELEIRVTELERECEGLRRENGWLKGLVVGVTGAGAGQQHQTAAVSEGVKRLREDSVSK